MVLDTDTDVGETFTISSLRNTENEIDIDINAENFVVAKNVL